MKYKVSNEQMLLLGGLLHYEKVVGIENNIGDIGLEELGEKWRSCEQELIHKKLLYHTPDQTLGIDKTFLIVLDSIMNPDIVFMIQDISNEEEMTYFYIKKNRAVCMKNNDECEIEVFEELSLFMASLSAHLGLTPHVQCPMEIESVPFSRSSKIEVKKESKLVTGIKFKEGIDEIWVSMRTFSDEKGNYLIKYQQDKQKDEVLWIKGSVSVIMSQLFNFE